MPPYFPLSGKNKIINEDSTTILIDSNDEDSISASEEISKSFPLNEKDFELGKFSPQKTIINEIMDKGKGHLMHQFEVGSSSRTKSKKNVSFHCPSIKCCSFDPKLATANISSDKNSPEALKEDSRKRKKRKKAPFRQYRIKSKPFIGMHI